MDLGLQGKRVLITGGSKGLGQQPSNTNLESQHPLHWLRAGLLTGQSGTTLPIFPGCLASKFS